MQRRSFIKTASVVGATGLALPSLSFAKTLSKKLSNNLSNKVASTPNEPWKTVEISTQITTTSDSPSQIWLPVPLAHTPYQDLISTEWQGNFTKAGLAKDKKYSAEVFYGHWEKSDKIELTVTHQVRIRNRSFAVADYDESADLYLQPTAHVPLDGIVKETALKIVKSETNTDKKAKLIYNWVTENTFRDPKIQGCGLGDVKSLLLSGTFGGKCADLSSLFVGLCRAAGVPAREVFGIRVLPSTISKSIGKAGDVTSGQHCRAEYYSKNNGWIPVDPADVRKVILEENLDFKDAHAQNIREKFFGFWEMNWIAFNSARDCTIPPNYAEDINYLMYPRFTSEKIRKDGMSPEQFKYAITAKELA